MSASRILAALKARPLSEVASYGVILVRNALDVPDRMRTLDRDALERAFAGCFDALRPAGELIIGWNDVAEHRPLDMANLQSVARLRPLTSGPWAGHSTWPIQTTGTCSISMQSPDGDQRTLRDERQALRVAARAQIH